METSEEDRLTTPQGADFEIQENVRQVRLDRNDRKVMIQPTYFYSPSLVYIVRSPILQHAVGCAILFFDIWNGQTSLFGYPDDISGLVGARINMLHAPRPRHSLV